MDKRYEKFNEITFMKVAYTAIRRNGKRARAKERARSKIEISMYGLPPNMEPREMMHTALDRDEPVIFHVKDHTIEVHNEKLGQAIDYLMPRERAIILLYYYANMSDHEISEALAVSRSTVQRQRNEAQRHLKTLMERLA